MVRTRVTTDFPSQSLQQIQHLGIEGKRHEGGHHFIIYFYKAHMPTLTPYSGSAGEVGTSSRYEV